MVSNKGVAVDAMLTLKVTAQTIDQNLYIAPKAVPTVRCASEVARMKNFKLEDLKKIGMPERLPGAEFKQKLIDIEDKYVAPVFYGQDYPVAEEFGKTLDNVKEGVAQFAMQDALTARELELEALLFTASQFDTADITTLDLTSTTVNPIKVVKDGKKTVKNAGFYYPNAIAMTEDVFDAFIESPFVEDKLSYNGVGGTDLRMANEAKLAEILGVKYLHVVRHPLATKTRSLVLYYVDEVMPEDKPNTFITVARDYAPSVQGAGGIGITKMFFDNKTDSDTIRVKGCFKSLLKTKSLGLLYSSITVA